MARIRTVKPELWTDPDFIECSLSARLLLIALLNFASDYGVLPDKPKQLKMQCLPADPVDIEPLVEELIASRFLVRRTAPDGSNVLVIRTFSQHQKVNRPSDGRWGNPAEWDGPPPPKPVDSVTPHGGLTEDSRTEGKGRELEGKGTGREGIIPVVVSNNSESVIHRQDDDDGSYSQTVEIIVAAKEAIERPSAPRPWRTSVRKNTHVEDGADIRKRLADGDEPLAIAKAIVGSRIYAEAGARAVGIDVPEVPEPDTPRAHDLGCRTCGGGGYVPDSLDAHGEPAPGCRWVPCTAPHEPERAPASVTNLETRRNTA